MTHGQEPLPKKKYANGLGFHAGATTGLGFSYRHMFEHIGFQLTGIPVINGAYKSTFLSTGGSLLIPIKSHRKADIFGYVGAHNVYQKSEWYDWEGLPFVDRRNLLNIGLGAGANFHFWEVIDLSVQFGYAGYNLRSENSWNKSFMLTGEIGLYYRF